MVFTVLHLHQPNLRALCIQNGAVVSSSISAHGKQLVSIDGLPTLVGPIFNESVEKLEFLARVVQSLPQASCVLHNEPKRLCSDYNSRKFDFVSDCFR